MPTKTAQKLVEALKQHMAGDMAGAEPVYRKVLKKEPRNADAHNLLSILLEQTDRPEEALRHAERALQIRPDYPEAHNARGNAFRALEQTQDAVAAFKDALALSPDYLDALINLGRVLSADGWFEEAKAYLDKALALDPNNAEVLVVSATALERLNRLNEAEAEAHKALAVAPDDLRLVHLLAVLDRRAGRLEEARRRIEAPDWSALPEGHPLAYRGPFELGRILDRLGDRDGAMAAFAAANQAQDLTPRCRRISRKAYPDHIRRYKETFTPEWLASWTPDPPAAGPFPIFVFGFPRSGTTLTEQILDSHENLQVLEEKPMTRVLFQKLMTSLPKPTDYPDVLARLGEIDLLTMRADFHAVAASLARARPGTLLVDKNPLNIVEVGFIQRLFPGAPMIFIQRHPCDAVLSCFMQSFKGNEAMVLFNTIESAARLYDQVMDLWNHLQSLLPLNLHVMKYEDMVADLEGEAKKLTAFLGLPFDPKMLAYRDTAREKAKISTPSYSQVTEPIYTRAAGRWRRYEKYLEPATPYLEKWIKAFGYD